MVCLGNSSPRTGQVFKFTLSGREIWWCLPIRRDQRRDMHLIGRDSAVLQSRVHASLTEHKELVGGIYERENYLLTLG